MARYRVGCAGMFAQGADWGTDDLDEAIAGCVSPPGCEVVDTQTGRSLGPESMAEIEEARVRLAARGDGARS
jgi:hypothetical protein